MSWMLKPQYWIYIIEIARHGGLYKKIPMSTTRMGIILDVSQQTASRRMASLEARGYIVREQDGNNTMVSITEKGKMVLLRLNDALNDILRQEKSEISLRGKVISGLGEGRYYVNKYATFIEDNLDITPFSGTLNAKLLAGLDVTRRKHIEMRNGILMHGFTDETRSFGDVWAYRVDVINPQNGECRDAYILKIQRTHYDESIVELISPHNLRADLGLMDGDLIKIVYQSRDASNGCDGQARD